MTGPEHYRHAEALLVTAADPDEPFSDAARLGGVQVAQVHATLALAAFTSEDRALVHGSCDPGKWA